MSIPDKTRAEPLSVEPGTVLIMRRKELGYDDGLRLQQECFDKVRASGSSPAFLLLVEHTPVVTLGRSSHKDHIVAARSEFERRGVAVAESNRGGDVTFHGPGQLVAYPIMSLDRIGRDLHRYMRLLESWVISVCARWNIGACRRSGLTGVWVDDRKIASIGIAARHWIAYHGMAMNVNTDLSFFDLIVPCGIHGLTVTSMARETGREIDLEEVSRVAVEEFLDVFDLKGRDVEYA